MLSYSDILKLEAIAGSSPFYLIDRKRFEANFDDLTNAFSSRYQPFILAYSYKTNYIPYLCEIIRQKGGWAEVVSRMEYDLALKVGQQPSKIIFNGPVKTAQDIALALDSGSIVNADSESELELIMDYAERHPSRPIPIGLRINIGLSDEAGRSHIQNSLKVGRFGFDPAELNSKLKIENSKLKVVCLHGHTSTTDRDKRCFEVITQTLCHIAEKYFPDTVESINVGGGFFGRMHPDLPFQNVPTWQEYADVIGGCLNANQWAQRKKPTLVIEPGVAMAADCLSFITKVISVKKIRGQVFITVDGSAFHAKPTFHTLNLPHQVITKNNGRTIINNVDVVGSTCMEKDILLKDIAAPEPRPGDYIKIDNVGAYTVVMTPPFINPAPAILADENGSYKLIRKKQTLDEIFSNYQFERQGNSAALNKNITITGDHIRLRPLVEGDMALKVKWYNDPAVRNTLVVDEVFDLQKTISWFRTLVDNSTRADFRVESLEGMPIGITGLIDIDRKNKIAQCYCVVGEKAYWGKGLGTEIHSVLFQWGFETLNIDKIWASIRTNNPAIFRVIEKLGFKIEGTLRQDKIVNGRRIDLYHIGLLRDEFTPAHSHYEIK